MIHRRVFYFSLIFVKFEMYQFALILANRPVKVKNPSTLLVFPACQVD